MGRDKYRAASAPTYTHTRGRRSDRIRSHYDPVVINRERALHIVAWTAFVLALVYFLWRGVWRGAVDSGDLSIGSSSSDLAIAFSAARAWLIGHNPYDVAVLHNELASAGGGNLANTGLLETLRNVYFPVTLPIFVPFALVPWPAARVLAVLINAGASVFIALGGCRLLEWRLTSSKALALTAFLLAWAPVQTTLASGQTGVAATAAVVAAVLLERSGRASASGVMYGIATAIKVQIGLPFIAYLLWRRRWASALASCLVLGASTVVSVVRMQVAGAPWLNAWLANMALVSGSGGINDPGSQNPERFSLINLQYPVSSLIGNSAVVELLTIGAVGITALVFIWLHRDRDPHPDLLALAVVAVLGLLVVYHRDYDAVLLAIPVVWGCSVMGTARWRQGAIVLALCADFFLRAQTGLQVIGQRQILPSWLTSGVFWNTFVLAQHVWALVLMAIVLLVAAAKNGNTRATGDGVVSKPAG